MNFVKKLNWDGLVFIICCFGLIYKVLIVLSLDNMIIKFVNFYYMYVLFLLYVLKIFLLVGSFWCVDNE